MSSSTANPTTIIDWQQIDTVLLDMDGTLLDLHFDNHFWLEHLPKRYAALKNSDPERVRQDLQQRFASQRGRLNWYCLDYWSQQLQVDIPALKAEIAHMIAIRPHVLEFLQQLQRGPQRVVLVTNAHRDSLELKLSQTHISPWFDDIVVSHDFRAPKEDQQFWQQLQLKHPFDPARSLLIDDTASVLSSAQRYGIKHLLTLLQPDSKQPCRPQGEFPAIVHFDEIMPEPCEHTAQGKAEL